MASIAQSDCESNFSGFVRYNDKNLDNLYTSLLENMEVINQNVIAVEKNLQNIIKHAGPSESQLVMLLQHIHKPNINLTMETN